MNMVEQFNARASGTNDPASIVQRGLETDISSANPDAVKAMHQALDVPLTPATEEELRDFNNTMRDLAEASGVEGASGGRILSGAAAGSDHLFQAEHKKEKKRRELTDLLQRMNAIHNHLQERANLMNELAEQLRDKADTLMERYFKRSDLAEDMDRILDECDGEMDEHGKIPKGNRDALEKAIKKGREELKLDPVILDALTDRDILALGRQVEDDLHKAAHEDHEQAHDCRKTAKILDERAEDLAEELEKIKELPVDQREAAYRAIFENVEDEKLLEKAVELLDDPETTQAMNGLLHEGNHIVYQATEDNQEPVQPDNDVNLTGLDGMGF